jgi:hypothetical protein
LHSKAQSAYGNRHTAIDIAGESDMQLIAQGSSCNEGQSILKTELSDVTLVDEAVVIEGQYKALQRYSKQPLSSSFVLVIVSQHRKCASRTMRKHGELFVRDVFDLGVRRKPQAFAADAVSLWILNPSLLIINQLEFYKAMLRWRTYSAHTASVW